MSGRTARNKGASAEREVANLFIENGFAARRGGHFQPQPGGAAISGDVLLRDFPTLHIEVKRQEKISIWSWIEQTVKDAVSGRWALIFRRNRSDWYVIVPFAEYLRLLGIERTFCDPRIAEMYAGRENQ